jgi:AcrR family transcriptional regulator
VTSLTQNPGRRARLSGAERREQILDVTKEVAFERGFHAVSIEVVAREAGISRPVVYNHFDDLQGLLEALIERESQRALQQLAAVLPKDFGSNETVEQMLAALRDYLEVVEADPLTWRLVLMPPEGAPEILRERIAEGRKGVIALLTEIVRGGAGPIGPSPDPELTARTLSALSDEGARLILTNPEHFSAGRIVDHARWLLSHLG